MKYFSLFAIIGLAVLMSSSIYGQDFIILNTGDTLKVKINKVGTSTIEYSFPEAKEPVETQCRKKLYDGRYCENKTKNVGGFCDMHSEIEYVYVDKSDVRAYLADFQWVTTKERPYDTYTNYKIETNLKEPKLLEIKEFNIQMSRVSDRLKMASNQALTAIVMGIVGAGMMIAGGAIPSEGLIYIGGGVIVVGFVVNISAWGNVGKAGGELDRARLEY